MSAVTRSCLALLLLSPSMVFAQVNATSEYLARMDSDGDGRVSQSEYLDWMSYAFDARDLNHDAVLSADELPGGKGQALTRIEHRRRLADRFDKQDANHDGHLSARELAAPPQ
jgi:Ca2+-binding EF-hand superfamily protein